ILLRDLSKQINRSFHKADILPQKLPLAVLNAALKADIVADAVGGAPNVLNLLVEAENKSKDSSVMRVMAIRLRPPELEFSDPQLSACRSRIRELMAKLQRIGKEYDKKQRERAIAEAESAWRSSWYDHYDSES
ncbi:MAG: hypothetical protein F6K09_14575, partial [Merismopedia sp. SIO2A8]|nr:hypothetical protein [Merismopedia sp. SIO2A8]